MYPYSSYIPRPLDATIFHYTGSVGRGIEIRKLVQAYSTANSLFFLTIQSINIFFTTSFSKHFHVTVAQLINNYPPLVETEYKFSCTREYTTDLASE
jgi:hypothetical protein